jgi:hypothetical protein
MTNVEKEVLAPLIYWSSRIEEAADQFDNVNTLGVRLPAAADRQLRNLAEATLAAQEVIQKLVNSRDSAEEILRQVAGRLGIIARELDNVVLPATVLD